MPPSFNERDVSDKPPFIQAVPRLDAEEVRALEESYRDRLASLLAVDEMVAKVVRELRAAGELDDTLVVFTSDNGYLMGEHRRRKKKDLYEESARVPLLMRGPGVPSGATAEQLVSNVDLSATILAATGAEPGRVVDGESLIPLAQDPTRAPGRAVLLENDRSAGVRVPGFAYYEHRDSAELYDLRADPFQLRNVNGVERYAEVRTSLASLLDRLRDCQGDDCLEAWSPAGVDVPPRGRGEAGAPASASRPAAVARGPRDSGRRAG
jgi:arylsulfatase A-like enzyme